MLVSAVACTWWGTTPRPLEGGQCEGAAPPRELTWQADLFDHGS